MWYVEYNGIDPTFGTAQATLNVKIAPADGFRIAAGFNINNNPPPPGDTGSLPGNIICRFVPTSGGKDCGPYIQGLAQEWIHDIQQYGKKAGDGVWTPTSSDPLFFMGNGVIQDTKGSGWDPILQGWPWGEVYWIGTQDLRIVFTDPCGNQVIQPLGWIRYTRVKMNAGVWQLVLGSQGGPKDP